MRTTSHRTAWWEFTLLDYQNYTKGPLKGVTGGKVTLTTTGKLRATGSLTLVDVEDNINFFSDRVKITYHAQDEEGNQESWDIGVFLLNVPKTNYFDGGRMWDVELTSLLGILDQGAFYFTPRITTNQTADSVVRLWLESSGYKVNWTPSESYLGEMLSWKQGSNELTVYNEALKAIQYDTLSVSPEGAYVIKPYVPPSAVATAHVFHEGEDCVHLASWVRNHDYAKIPNRVFLIGEMNKEERDALHDAKVGMAHYKDEPYPYSYVNRGRRWVDYVETGVKHPEGADLTAMARSVLADKASVRGTLEIVHMPLKIEPGDGVEFKSQGYEAKGMITKIEYDLKPHALCKTTITEAAWLGDDRWIK